MSPVRGTVPQEDVETGNGCKFGRKREVQVQFTLEEDLQERT